MQGKPLKMNNIFSQAYCPLNSIYTSIEPKREWAYDRKSHIGKLDKGLDYGNDHNWTMVDMKKAWKVIYPFKLKQ